MSILHKIVNPSDISTLELLLNGAFAPLHGYLNQDDHSSVLRRNRLANGTLWPLPLALALTPAEKREAQLSGRIVLVDGLERRAIAEVAGRQLLPPARRCRGTGASLRPQPHAGYVVRQRHGQTLAENSAPDLQQYAL